MSDYRELQRLDEFCCSCIERSASSRRRPYTAYPGREERVHSQAEWRHRCLSVQLPSLLLQQTHRLIKSSNIIIINIKIMNSSLLCTEHLQVFGEMSFWGKLLLIF